MGQSASARASDDAPYRGRFADGAHRYALRVYFEDTDAGGVVYHGRYLGFLERARSDMLACAGIDQAAALAAGEGVYAIAQLSIAYRRPAHLDDALLIESRVVRLGGASCAIQQRVMRGDELVAEAEVTAVLVAPDGRPKRQPRAWIEAFEGIAGAQPGGDQDRNGA